MHPAPTLVLLAAGLGSRYGGLKQLDPVGPGGAAILDYTLADAARAGFGRAVLVVRPEIEGRVRRHLARAGGRGLPTTFAHQTLAVGLPAGVGPPEGRSRPWGTAHAVLAAAPLLDGPFAVANADDHYGEESWRCLGGWLGGGGGGEGPGAPAAAVVGYRLADTLSGHGGVSRGVIEAGGDGLVVGVVEATGVRREEGGDITATVVGGRRVLDGEALISMNLWGFRPEVLPVLAEAFRAFVTAGPGARDELYLSDVVGDAASAGGLAVRLLPCGTGWFGMTHPEDRHEVARRLAQRGPPGTAPSPHAPPAASRPD